MLHGSCPYGATESVPPKEVAQIQGAKCTDGLFGRGVRILHKAESLYYPLMGLIRPPTLPPQPSTPALLG